MIAPPDIGSVPPVSLKRVNEDRANTELCLAKETFTDWSCFETWRTSAWNYWRPNER